MRDGVKLLRVEQGRSVAIAVFTYKGREWSAVNYLHDRFDRKTYDLRARVGPEHRTFASCHFEGSRMVVREDLIDMIPAGYHKMIDDKLLRVFRSVMVEAGW